MFLGLCNMIYVIWNGYINDYFFFLKRKHTLDNDSDKSRGKKGSIDSVLDPTELIELFFLLYSFGFF